jgi:hypothetical protein
MPQDNGLAAVRGDVRKLEAPSQEKPWDIDACRQLSRNSHFARVIPDI